MLIDFENFTPENEGKELVFDREVFFHDYKKALILFLKNEARNIYGNENDENVRAVAFDYYSYINVDLMKNSSSLISDVSLRIDHALPPENSGDYYEVVYSTREFLKEICGAECAGEPDNKQKAAGE